MDYPTFANSHAHTNMKNRYIQRSFSRQHRQSIVNTINGDAFFPMDTWPQHIKRAFRAQPISDRQAFQLIIFFFGNGCSPELAAHVIYSSQLNEKKIKKRFDQFRWVSNNLSAKGHTWYYHDIYRQSQCYLNGTPK
eukprot:TCONS_00042686-protein